MAAITNDFSEKAEILRRKWLFKNLYGYPQKIMKLHIHDQLKHPVFWGYCVTYVLLVSQVLFVKTVGPVRS